MPDSSATLVVPSDDGRDGEAAHPSLLVDRDGRQLAVNAAFAALTGLPGLALIGRHLDEFSIDGGAMVQRGLRYLDAGIAVPEHEILVGDRRYLGAVSAVRDERRRVVGGVVNLIPVVEGVFLSRRREPGGQAAHQRKWIDALTGLCNARCHLVRLTRELRLMGRTGDALSLVVVDIDGYENYMATEDGVAPEDCVRLVAETASGVAHRPADVVCRIGVSRLGTILPHTDAPGGLRVAERIRLAVRGLGIAAGHMPEVSVLTVSAGVVTVASRPEHARSLAEEMIRLAEEALTRAQARGVDQAEPVIL